MQNSQLRQNQDQSAANAFFSQLNSAEDLSVNWVSDHPVAGKEEARFVRREEDYFIVYLSSQTGCEHACRFCHLTQTGQTKLVDLPIESIIKQAEPVFAHYDKVLPTQGKAERVHFNFMARGEPLANPHLIKEFRRLHAALSRMATSRGLEPHFKLSTIMPKVAENIDLYEAFGDLENVGIYYSLYAFDEKFRKRWLPKAMCPYTALDKIANYQQKTGALVAIHGAFIDGENDTEENAEQMAMEVAKRGIRAKFNLVRYNPFSESQGAEASEEQIQKLFKILQIGFDHTDSRIVPRVGFDVKASCGMFVQ